MTSSTTTASEKELYEPVSAFMRGRMGCKATKINTGTRFGQIDVLAIRTRTSDFASNDEVIAVEVKKGGTRFLNFLAQALSYSLYAHRVYLAWQRTSGAGYTQEEIDIASHFGVGLLEIDESERVALISSSSKFQPERQYLMQAVQKLQYFECSICRSVYPIEKLIELNQPGEDDLADDPNYRGRLADAISQRRSSVYYLFELSKDRGDSRTQVWDRRYLCKECSSIFASLLPKSV